MSADSYNQDRLEAGHLTGEMLVEMAKAVPSAFTVFVEAFQLAKGLDVDGYAGKATQAATEPPPPAEPTVVPADLADSTEVQKGLAMLGYYDGDIDGDLSNPEFRADLKKFQARMRITRDGLYGRQSEGKLKPLLEKLKQFGPSEGLVHLNRWFCTYYYLADEKHYSGDRSIPVMSPQGQLLDTVTPRMFAAMALEGTGIMEDGRLLNVASNPSTWKIDPKILQPIYDFAKSQGWIPKKPGYAGIYLNKDGTHANRARTFAPKDPGPLGYGVLRKIPLDPYRTLATDIGVLRKHDARFKGKGGVCPSRTKVFILEFAGMQMPATEQHPDGWEHDGWFVCNDTGGGIYGAHFDVFTGTRALAKAIKFPATAHVWWDGMEDRLPDGMNYDYGLQGH
jgi:hypothetical protein